MDEVKKLYQEAEKRRRLNAKQLHKILVPKTEYTRRSTKPLTEPEEFSFNLASRLGYKMPKGKSMKKVHEIKRALMRINLLSCFQRKPRMSMSQGPTCPVPFNFETNRRVKKSSKPRTYVPLLAKVDRFFRNVNRKRPLYLMS